MKSFIVTALFVGLTGTMGLMAQSTGRGNAGTQTQPTGTSSTVKGEGKKESNGTQNGRFESKEAQRNHAEARSNGHAYSGKGQSKKPASQGGDKGNGHSNHEHDHNHDHATQNGQKQKAPGSQRQSTDARQKSR